MRTFCTFFAILMLFFPVFGQADQQIDTLLLHTFEGILDPADTMLTEPTGDDLLWVNYDQDNLNGLCVSNGPTPKGWYWESDLGFIDPNTADNYAFTSCSYLQSNQPQNRNWLITSPVHLPDNTYRLGWRSLTYYGPDFMDGYRVLVSTSTNLPESFTDTLFSAAQTVSRLQIGSLDLNDYVLSPGYIHADGYTKAPYFFIDYEGNAPFYHGKLEPHTVDLSKYAGQTIYIAFLHDSYDDFQLQVDDILVTNNTVATNSPSNFEYFTLFPNPAPHFSFVNWKARSAQSGVLNLVDLAGKVVFEQAFKAQLEGQIKLDLHDLAAGVYYCKLTTASSQATKLLVKR